MRAMIRQYDGDLDGALADLDAAQAVSADFGSLDINDEVFIQLRRCDLYQRRGEHELAAEALARARDMARRSPPEIDILLDALEGGLLTRWGQLDRAEELLSAAEERLMPEGGAFSALTGDHGVAIVGALKAALAIARDEPAAAAAALAVAYPAAVVSQDMPILSMIGVGVAEVAWALHDHRDTATLLGASARLRGAEDPTEPRIARLTRDARAALGGEDFDEAYAAGWSLDPQAARARVDPAHRPGPTPTVEGGHALRA
jgi:tetratricopeptide (TPR) repeat protein